jgi:hypothetical protein
MKDNRMSDQQSSYKDGDQTEMIRVRQGVVSFRIISILIISTCLALAIIGAVWLGFAPHAHHGIGQADPVPGKTAS